MPTFSRTTGRSIPVISSNEFEQRLEAVGGRKLSLGERRRAERMSEYHWTLRVIATRLFGAKIVDAYFSPKG